MHMIGPKHAAHILAAVLLTLGCAFSVCAADRAEQLESRYRFIDASACKKPSEHGLPELPDAGWYRERRFLDLDSSGVCQAMDVWYEELSEFSPYQHVPRARIFVFADNQWLEASTFYAQFFPYVIEDIKRDVRILINPNDIQAVTGEGGPGPDTHLVLFHGWDLGNSERRLKGAITLTNDDIDPIEVWQALGILLTRRCAGKGAIERRLPDNTCKEDLQQAREFVRIANRGAGSRQIISVDKDGLPKIR